MKKYGIEMEGPFIAEKVSSLPSWTSADEGRIVYDETTKVVYYGDDSGWVEGSKSAGTIEMFAGAPGNIPSGYLLCDGSALSTTTYARLFAAIGYTWGGAGASFNLPDMAEKGPYGPGGGRSVGDTDGDETKDIAHAHTMKNHTHTTSGHALTIPEMPAHVHPAPAGNFVVTPSGSITGGGDNATSQPNTGSTGGGASHDHGPTGAPNDNATDSGGSGTQDVLNPIAVVTFIIKT
jgi:microcystin-dependent protein